MTLKRVNDKDFKQSIPEEKILQRVKEVADEINRDFKFKNPLFLAVLNGSFMFASDLMKQIEIDCELQFVRLKSYQGMHSTATVQTLLGPTQAANGRSVIVIEDIVETGETLKALVNQLHPFHPNEIKVCSLLVKPDKYNGEIPVDYKGFDIADDFVIGYGLDYDGLGRNLKDIYTVTE